MTIEHLTSDQKFMNEFSLLANESYTNYGSYEDVYMTYEDQISDDEILALLDYCEDNDLLDC